VPDTRNSLSKLRKAMALRQELLEFLNANARQEGINELSSDDDLFKLGVLDSFAVVDFVTLLEEHYQISVKDSDVVESNFQTLKVIEGFINRVKRASE